MNPGVLIKICTGNIRKAFQNNVSSVLSSWRMSYWFEKTIQASNLPQSLLKAKVGKSNTEMMWVHMWSFSALCTISWKLPMPKKPQPELVLTLIWFSRGKKKEHLKTQDQGIHIKFTKHVTKHTLFWRGAVEHLSSTCKPSFYSKCHKMALVGLEVSPNHSLDPWMTLGSAGTKGWHTEGRQCQTGSHTLQSSPGLW